MFNPAAIQRYLEWKPRPPYPVKKMTEEQLLQIIEECTGLPFQPKTPPRGLYQLATIAFALAEERVGMFLDMRMGKGYCALNWAEHLRKCGKWKRQGLVIVPSPIILDVWETEARKHSNLSISVARLKFEDFLAAIDSDSDLVAVPWSALQAAFTMRVPPNARRSNTKSLYPDFGAIDELSKFFDLVIFDEIHTCKNTKSLRFSIANRLVMRSNYRAGLTGTPFGRDPFHIWAQAFLLDEGRAFGYNEQFFKVSFGTKKLSPFGRKGVINGGLDPKKKKLFEERLSSFSIAYTLKECFEIKMIPNTIELRMLPEQAHAYSGMMSKVIDAAKRGLTDTEHAFMRLRQISSGYLPVDSGDGDDEKEIIRFPSAKMEYLDQFISEIPDRAKIIIFHEFTETGRSLCELLSKHGREHAWLYGGTKDKIREVYKFTEGRAQVLVINSASGAMGIDLQVADYQLFFECPVSPIIRKQAEFRAMAPSREGTLFLDDLVCSPVERRVLGFIREGKSLLAELVHGKVAWEDLR